MGKPKAGRNWNSTSNKSRDLAYPTMSVDEIKAMNVKSIAADDAHLYLWTTNQETMIK